MTLQVDVVYAMPAEQVVMTVQVPIGATVRDAIQASGILERFAEIDLAHAAIGVFGKRVALTDVVAAQDRVEIYRPLRADPKETRHRRAHKRRRG